MTLSNFVPLGVALLVFSPILVARVHDGVDSVLTRAAIQLFGRYVDEFRAEHPHRREALQAAHFPITYREYGSKTVLYAAILAVVGSILGMYVIWAILLVLAIEPATMREALPASLEFLANLGGVPALSLAELFVLILVSCLTLGAVAGGGTYWLRWWYPAYVADARARRIEAALPSTVAFVFALSRSGMEFPKVIRIVAANRDTYGEAAREFDVAVRNMDTFGVDVITAIQTMGRRTPSPQFREFTENLVSVLQSGHSLSEFLERQHHEYQGEAESQQERLLELLRTLAEAYVTVLVAGPLFLITILVVIGISVGETLEPLTVVIYVIVPFGNLAFIVYLSMVTDGLNPGTPVRKEVAPPSPALVDVPRTDGGHEAVEPNVERLRHYRRLRGLRERFGNPVQTLVDRPAVTLLLTVPIGLLAVGWSLTGVVSDGGFDVTAIDDVVALAALFVLASFAVVYELHRTRTDAIEAAIPDLLDRLASVNEAGMPMIAAIDHVRGSDLGALDVELDRLWADVQWGATLELAFRRLEARVPTRSVSRMVTLLTEAMNASGNLSTVLRIAARQLAADRRLKRERGQAMLEYLVVVYVSFLVFCFIIAVLAAYLLPNLPTGIEATSTAEPTDVEGIGGLAGDGAGAYTTLFYHATLLQGILSGFVAGQLSTGDVKAGAKHAAVMVALAFGLFVIVG